MGNIQEANIIKVIKENMQQKQEAAAAANEDADEVEM